MIPVLTIAGSDCSGGAGIQADLKAFAANGVYGMSAISAVTAQIPGNVIGFEPVSPELLQQQLEVLLGAYKFGAIKTGMLATAELVSLVCEVLEDHREIPLVVDPVMIATSGAALLSPDAVDLYRNQLLPLATVFTPNLPEAASLANIQEPRSKVEMERLAKMLCDIFGSPVFLKGGHLPASTEAIDILHEGERIHFFECSRISIPGTESGGLHGTGCTLASAIAAQLARGESLPDAAAKAKVYLTATIEHRTLISGDDGPPALQHFPSLTEPASPGDA